MSQHAPQSIEVVRRGGGGATISQICKAAFGKALALSDISAAASYRLDFRLKVAVIRPKLLLGLPILSIDKLTIYATTSIS